MTFDGRQILMEDVIRKKKNLNGRRTSFQGGLSHSFSLYVILIEKFYLLGLQKSTAFIGRQYSREMIFDKRQPLLEGHPLMEDDFCRKVAQVRRKHFMEDNF